MKKLTLTTLCTFAILLATAQRDTTLTEGLDDHSLEIGLGSNGAHAQIKNQKDPTGTEPDTLTFKTKRKVITVVSRLRRPDEWTVSQREDSIANALRRQKYERTNWAGLDLGLNTLLSPDNGLDLKGPEEAYELELVGSRFFSINFMEQKIEFGSPYIGLLTGLGLEFTSYKFKNDVRLAYNNDTTFMIQNYTDTAGMLVELVPSLRKNKLRQMGLRVPLMLEFNTSRDRKRSFHLAAGLVGTLYFDTMYKQKFTSDGEKQKTREKGDFNLLPYRVAAAARIGYGGFNLFAEYSLTSLFEDGKGIELTPLNVGMTLVAF